MIDTKELKLGLKVIFDAEYIRIETSKKIPFKEWTKVYIKPKIGIIIGVRTIYDGNIWRDYEEGITFERTNHKQCALVVENLYRNSVRVPIECIIKIKD